MEEPVEDQSLVLRADANPAIANIDADLTVPLLETHLDPPFIRGILHGIF